MRYTPLSKALYTINRKKLYQHLEPNSAVVLSSNHIMPTNADGTMGFKQNSDLFYLSGIDQEETYLILYPDAPEERFREMLFIQETNAHIRIWEGEKLTKKQATEQSGIEQVHWNDRFQTFLSMIMGEVDQVYLYTNEHARQSNKVETANRRLIKSIQEQYPLHDYKRLYPITRSLRMIKEEEEITQIGRACDITHKGFQAALNCIEPGKMEYEVEAAVLHEFIASGSRGFAYTPIIAGGGNACALHYITNDSALQDGDLVLMDIGAEYGNYASDLTRTVPVNGRFTDRQKEVYNAVLRTQKKAISLLKPGNTWIKFHKQVGQMMTEELLQLGLLTKQEVKEAPQDKPAYKKYFMHGTSHHMGLDVHDVMDMYAEFEPGMVFTCEPGIYIREEGIGIRIENDVVVTQGEAVDLMKDIPREVEEIEAAMAKS